MRIDEAAGILAEMYHYGLKKQEGVAHLHLFGIMYAEQIDGMSLPELVKHARIPDSYKTEIKKGMKLSKYVELKR